MMGNQKLATIRQELKDALAKKGQDPMRRTAARKVLVANFTRGLMPRMPDWRADLALPHS
jgi:hypothetical protein